MKKYFVFAFFMIFYFTYSAFPQEKMRVVVLDLNPIGVSKTESRAISKLLESDVVDSRLFLVVERDQIDEILKEQGLQQTGCTDSACAVEIGKLLSANKILMGEISRLGRTIILTLRIVDVEKGLAEFSVSQKARSIESIDEAVNKIVRKLVARLRGEASGRFVTKIDAPRNFTVSHGRYRDRIELKWDSVKGANKYYVFRSSTVSGKYKMIRSTEKLSFTDRSAEEGEEYYYKVRGALYSKTGRFSEVKAGMRGRSEAIYYLRGIIPGLGQIYYGNNMKGYMFLGGFVCITAGLLYSYKNYSNKRDSYNSIPYRTSESEADSIYNDYKKAANITIYSLFLWAAYYAANWVDLLYFNEPVFDSDPGISVSRAPVSFNVYMDALSFKKSETRIDLSVDLKF